MPSPITYAFQIALLAVWLTCAGVGVTGLALGWPPPVVKKADPPPVEATLIETALQNETTPDIAVVAEPVPPPPEDQPPPPPDLPDLPPLPTLPAFVEKVAPSIPDPKLQTKPKPTRETAPRTSASAATGAPSVQNLTMGQGEGRQPAPPYPRDALSRRQEGTVIVQLLVGADGNVLSAEVWQSSPWPLLNEAAVRTVRGRWQFAKGAVRLYHVPIRFRIER